MKKRINGIVAMLVAVLLALSVAAVAYAEPEVIFTSDSAFIPGGTVTVDIEKMTDLDSAIYNAWLEGEVEYLWCLDGVEASEYNGKSIILPEDSQGVRLSVTVKCFDLEITRDAVIGGEEISITTKELANAIVGSQYDVQLECNDETAEFVIYYNPGKDNDFDKTGLTLSSSGRISGVPDKAGSYTFAVCAAGESGEAYAVFTIVVKEEPQISVTNTPDETPTASQDSQSAIPTQTPTQTATTDAPDQQLPTPTAQVTEPPQDNDGGWMLATFGAAAIAIAALVMIILILKNNKKQ